MPEYLLPEGRISLPDEPLQDASITMLRFPARGTSLTVSRAPLPAGQNTGDVYRQQLDQVRKTKSRFVIREQREISTGVDGLVSGTEVLSQFMQGDTPIFQYQFAGQCGPTMVIFCYSRAGAFTPNDIVHWQSILAGFQPSDH